MRGGRQLDKLFRYHTLRILKDIGFFDYLQTPRTYGEILAKFEFVDIAYTRFMMEILSADKDMVVDNEGEFYRAYSDNPVPDLSQLIQQTDERFRGFNIMAEGMTQYILPRLRQQPISLSKTFEQDGREFLIRFDKVLAIKVYSAFRNACFAYLTKKDMAWLRGKKLLDIGCGSGRETAELWIKFGGDIRITAIDTVESMIELADQNFEAHLRDINRDHPPVTSKNRPIFKVASATRMPFKDNQFDASFWLLVLHWTPDPKKAIHEAVRVVRPGGLLFGGQSFRPMVDAYLDLVIRSNENCYGAFWREEYIHWFEELGLEIDLTPYAGMMRVINNLDGNKSSENGRKE